MSCEIGNNESNFENATDGTVSKRNKTIYLHLKKFFRGTRFTFKPFLQSLQNKHKEGDTVCVSGQVSFTCLSKARLLLLTVYCINIDIVFGSMLLDLTSWKLGAGNIIDIVIATRDFPLQRRITLTSSHTHTHTQPLQQWRKRIIIATSQRIPDLECYRASLPILQSQ